MLVFFPCRLTCSILRRMQNTYDALWWNNTDFSLYHAPARAVLVTIVGVNERDVVINTCETGTH